MKGLYAEVRQEVEGTVNRYIEIYFSMFTKRKNAITFVSDYFFDHYSRTEDRGLKITIPYLNSMDVDTNNMVVFFVVVNALCQAFGVNCDLLISESASFVVPK